LSKRDDGSDLHRLAIRAIGRFQAVPELARCLIAEHANEYRDAKIESDQIIEECGF
jgi:hypothetical protein